MEDLRYGHKIIIFLIFSQLYLSNFPDHFLSKDDAFDAEQKIIAMHYVVMNGRTDDTFWKVVKPFFAAMLLPKERLASVQYKFSSNMSGRIDYNRQYGVINGKCLDQVMTHQRVAMMMLVIENNISKDE